MNLYNRSYQQRQAVLDVMKQGGYYQRIMDSGPELNRVKQYIQIMDDKLPKVPSTDLQQPTFLPLFPGINYQPFRDNKGDDVAHYLESAVDLIREDSHSIQGTRFGYDGEVITEGLWQIYPFWYMGIELSFLANRIPKINNLVKNMPRNAMKYPFSEALLSWQTPGTHLKAHCSVDGGLRLRYSLGVIVNDYCEIRVESLKRNWNERECIIFEDSFEHETWNGGKNRLVFIIDTWHPDLTPIEIEALLAGFRKFEIRSILYEYRLTEQMRGMLLKKFQQEDDLETSDRYWEKSVEIVQPIITDFGNWKVIPVFK